MKIRTILVLSILFLLILIAGINWDTFTAPTEIFLLFTTISIPLGLSLLAVLGLLTAIFLVFLGRTQTLSLLKERNLNNELHKAQKLAASEEESRMRELRVKFIEEIDFIQRKLDLIIEHMDIGAPENDTFVPHGEPPIESKEDIKQEEAPPQLESGQR